MTLNTYIFSGYLSARLLTLLLIIASNHTVLSFTYYDYYADYGPPPDTDLSDSADASSDSGRILTVLPDSAFSLACAPAPAPSDLYYNDELISGDRGIRYNQTGHSYTVTGARERHAGRWRCGDTGPELQVFILPAEVMPGIILGDQLLSGEAGAVTVLEDQLVTPVCVAAGRYRGHTDNKWRLNGEVINHTSQVMARLDTEGRDHLSFTMDTWRVSRSQQGHVLECSLQGNTARVTLHVEYPPQFTISRVPHFGVPVVTGSRVSLFCDVDSEPASQPYWERNGLTLSDSADLELTSVTSEDEGWYQCNANHKLGNYSSVGYFLAVKAESELSPALSTALPCLPDADSSPGPRVFTPLHNVSTTRGHNVTIYTKYCSTQPALAVIWTGPKVLVRHQEDLTPTPAGRFRTSTVASGDTEDCTTVSLAIGEVTMEDGGLYVILVSSSAGAGQGRVWLDVAAGEERRAQGQGATSGAGSLCDIILVSVITLASFKLLLPTPL